MDSTAKETFAAVPARFDFPGHEEKILEFWDKIDAFQTQLKKSEGRKKFTFYDGPPFATGLPHYGHVLAGTIKDVVTRYACSTGHYVERRFGWDTHGLPVEHEIDQKNGIKTRQDVLDMGIDVYNEKCRAIVMRYAGEWEKIVKRCGRWIDFKNDYKTLDVTFMESVWAIFKIIYDKGMVYQGYKVMPYSTHLNTPLSNFEAGLNYQDVHDPSVVVSFPLVSDQTKAFLAWTTTPWTLPSNLALCVNEAFEYITIEDVKTTSVWILAKSRLEQLYKKPKEGKHYKLLDECKGSDLVGMEYVPLFEYFHYKKEDGAFKVVCDDYVTKETGTGIVHQAPGFGEDDYRVCIKYEICSKKEAVPCPVDANGCFEDIITDFSGQHVKAADKEILRHLKANGRLIRHASFKHSYPFCWRSETPLIYKAVPSWFVNVTSIKSKLVKNNFETYWVPENVQRRFHNWLAGARDWAISRNRYWGTPLPIWTSEDFEEIVVVGSVEELEELTGASGITDLHRHKIDHLTIPSKQGKGELRRVDEVFDCWFESGSMPYGQVHYPFERKDDFQEIFPADFIAEGLDQTRGWFYTLMVLSTALFDKPTFRNLICNGLVLAEDGGKMSKRKKNYPDPTLILNQYGADALRLYLINSPVVRAKELKFKETGVFDVIKDVFLPWVNSYKFFVENATRYELETGCQFTPNDNIHNETDNVMDNWILSSLETLVEHIRVEMAGNVTREEYMNERKPEFDRMLAESVPAEDQDKLVSEADRDDGEEEEKLDFEPKPRKSEHHLGYRLYTVVPGLVKFLLSLSRWYVRLNRSRIRGQRGLEDSKTSLQTLYHVLLYLCRLMAPFTPFLAEEMYQNLKKCLTANGDGDEVEESVHYISLPEVNVAAKHPDIELSVVRMQAAVELGRRARDKKRIAIRRPLSSILVVHPDPDFLRDVESLRVAVEEELNVREVKTSSALGSYMKLRCDARNEIGKRLKGKARAAKAAIKEMTQDQIHELKDNGSYDFGDFDVKFGDVKITFEFTGDQERYATAESGRLLVMLDTQEDESLVQEGYARGLKIGIQTLRKEAELKPSLGIVVFYSVDDTESKEGQEIAQSLETFNEFVRKEIRQPLHHASLMPPNAFKIASGTTNVSGVTCSLTLTRPCAVLSQEALKARYPDDEIFREDLTSFVSSCSYSKLCKRLTENGGTFDIKLNDQDVSLCLGKDIFLSLDDLLKK